MKLFSFLILFFSINFFCISSYSQVSNNQKGGVKELISAIDTFRNRMPPEKLYLHLDKQNYIAGDTIWFKAYLLDGIYLTGSDKSGLFYLELANDSNKVIKRMRFPLKYGLGWGNITLDPQEYPEGTYVLRAYTNWMRNWKDDVFTRQFYIASPREQSWLVNTELNVSDKTAAELALQFSKLDKQPVGLREMQVSVLEGKKTLFRKKVQTTAEGALQANFTLPENADTKNMTLLVQDLRKGEGEQKLSIPLSVNRREYIDLQFMPEGGNLVVGILSKVGFKAISEDGKGVAVSGRILNNKQEEVAAFTSLHKGMGSFELKPQVGETYMAQLKLPGGNTKTYPLPEVKASGTALSVNNLPNSNLLEVSVSATADIQNSDNYYLMGQARGVVCYAKTINFKEATINTTINKDIFPSGIIRFTLLNKDYQPLNERISFINQQDNLKSSIATDKTSFGNRDSIALHLSVTDKENRPVQGTFSLAVTDDKQVKTDSISNSNIIAYMLLTSDLKGAVEDPNYYNKPTPEAQRDLDNLLLTQGWVGYDWKNVFNFKAPQYAAEPEFIITGKVTSTFGGISHTKVNLFSQKPFMLKDTLTDQNGRFTFKDFPPADTAVYRIQSYNRNGKSFIVDVAVDEWQPPVFNAIVERMKPWYVNSDSTLLHTIKRTIEVQNEEGKLQGKNVLEEVKITGKKIVPESRNLNGPGEADMILDEQDMLKAGKIGLWDLLFQRVSGLITGGYKFPPFWEPKFGLLLNGQLVKIVIDGIDVDQGYNYYQPLDAAAAEGEGMNERYQFMKNSLDNFTAEDILGIEVIYNSSYNTNYNRRFLSQAEFYFNKNGVATQVGGASGIDYAYIEITTRGGKGPYIKKTPGVYLYKPLPFSLPKQFYSPKYAVKDSTKEFPDLRSTIFWEPNIITDAGGKATVSFYSADKPSTYTIILEGSDMNGKVGRVVKERFIKVESPESVVNSH